MAQVRIVTDSTADIPAEMIEKLGIGVVPLKVHFGEETYLDGVTISPDAFYQKLMEDERLPTTSQPSPMDFVEIYRQAAAEGVTQILSIHLSSAMSGTYQSAMLAKSMVEGEIEVEVIDSKKPSYVYGMIVIAAARAAQAGQSLAQCTQLVYRMRDHVKVYFLVDTLEYLQKNGRIAKASALVGTLLNIKPILSVNEDGEVCPVEKVRGKNRAVGRIFELLQTELTSPIQAAVIHACDDEQANKVEGKLKEAFEVHELVRTYVGPVIGAHAGPKAIAIAAIEEKVIWGE
ncbi:DegV family protein [Mechercharimyces sp. CAU 1602]|uniref:DegV family protein n=1 Tax=Mechercharimyces sp. CAU 1602 TaxID=2973933 RepID=UPI002161401A|nr:DegV family protein [Mechercharimyces sp. CAU 1602]MCS1351380.1 DegV family protein [Mechercharimyces sp. CAU 1602]